MTRTEKLQRLRETLEAACACDQEGLSAYTAIALQQLADEAAELSREYGRPAVESIARQIGTTIPAPVPRSTASAFVAPPPRPLEVLPQPAGVLC